MGGRRPTSVILATIRWTPVIEELGEQLQGDDELLVVCDDADDPVASREDELPTGARLVFAGEPSGCSGKANAVTTGLEAARHDRIVWTDDDFHHPPDWLAQLHADYAEHGPVSETPFFVGKDWLARLLEPEYAVTNGVGLFFNDTPWGGAVMFERDDVDLDGYVGDLRRTVSDDGLLDEYVDITTLRRVRRVEIGGTFRESLERHNRFAKIVFRHAPRWQHPIFVLCNVVATVLALLFPVWMFLLATAVTGGMYAVLGVRRWTFLLAYPVIVFDTVLLCYAIYRQTFVWGGRRYQWSSKYDVRVLDSL